LVALEDANFNPNNGIGGRKTDRSDGLIHFQLDDLESLLYSWRIDDSSVLVTSGIPPTA